ncbi:hypothetical protein BC829DRAFT_51087 [Chytridium lagenaria]|nr:hypothetical protein BC829DRAFT_51087 [Chytridium lagenaria]
MRPYERSFVNEFFQQEAESYVDYWKPQAKPNRTHHDGHVASQPNQQFDPINHSPLPQRAAVRRIKPQEIDRNEPLATSLPKIGEPAAPRNRTGRKASNFVLRNNAKGYTYTSPEDESLPSYFRFGRPGGGAPILDASGGKDPRLTQYRGNKLIEKIRCYDETAL